MTEAASPEPNRAAGSRFASPTIRLRLTLWYGVLFLVTGGVLLGVNHALLRDRLENEAADVRVQAFEQLGLDPDRIDPLGDLGRRGADIRRRLAEARRRSVTDPARDAPAIDGVPVTRLIESVRQDLIDETLARNLRQSLIVLSGMAVASVGLGWMMAGRMLRPIGQVTATARQLSEHSLDRRVGLQGPHDEIKDLADQFDVMLDRLQRAFESQKAFVADASHELRTPLTVIRTELDVTLAQAEPSPEDLARVRRVVTSAIERANQLIDGLLTLARAETFETERVRMDQVVADVISLHRPAAEDSGITISSELAGLAVDGEPTLLRRVVENLIENAVAYNHDGGTVTVVLDSAGSGVRLLVSNSGPLVDPAFVPRMFDRFSRADAGRSRRSGGSGLGLAIVRSIVTAHGGHVQATARPEGGLVVETWLPAADPAGDPGDEAVRSR